jgi:putative transposase
VILAHKIALDPNDRQATHFAKAAGTARFAWNWALGQWRDQYQAGGKPNEMALRKQLNAIKDEQFPWMGEVTKNAPQQAIKNLGMAFKNVFEGRAKFPKFKKKGMHDSFRADNGPQIRGADAVAVDGKRVRLPVIGWVRMREPLRFAGQVKSAVVSRTADRWFVSLQVERPDRAVSENQGPAVGVDLGVKALATLSDGSVIEGPKALRKNLKKLRRASRALSRKVKGSSNRRKAKLKIARLHARIGNIRNDVTHKATTAIAKNHGVIVIEDLNVRGMMANDKLSRAIADVGLHEFRRQIEYKAKLNGARIIVADRWYPSSKTCSTCGYKMEVLPLSVREWTCPACGRAHDRDVNAAKNLVKLAVSSTVSACGEEGSGGRRKPATKPASVKQKSSVKPTYA